MSPVERVERVLSGRWPDRAPLSFWHHFGPDQVAGEAAVTAHLAHLEAFDLDFLKIMNDNGYPHAGPVERVADLASLTELRGDEGEFGRQLELIAALKRRLRGRVLMTTTVFNAWSTLRHIVRPPREHKPPNLAPDDEVSGQLLSFLAQDEETLRRAIRVAAASLANFARRCLDAGADGIFLSVRDDWLERAGTHRAPYADLVRSADLQILDGAARGRFNMLHVCGTPVHFGDFADYPVHVLNWADRSAGPAIADVRDWVKPAICAGLDNLRTLPEGTPRDCEREMADALHQASDRPILIAPGCTYDPERVPRANLLAVCRAVRASAGAASQMTHTQGRCG
ncbi:MAG TPA: uroporphyrinogen decarboxylase family protein [Phycisphaerae bacterium]|nr:uroporphyrinogen decarboxylase family protein [Phycisphaerae bacterium]